MRKLKEMVKFVYPVVGQRSKNFVSNGAKLMKAGVDKVILDLFREYPPSLENSKYVKNFLVKIIRYLEGDLVKFFRDGAGVEIVRTLEEYEEDFNVQSNCLFALRTLGKSRPNAILLVSEELRVEDILKRVMDKYDGKEKVQSAALSTILCLASTEQANEVLWEADIVGYIVGSMRKHPTNPKIQEYGLAAIGEFDFQYSLVRLGVHKLAIEVLRNFPQKPNILIKAFKTLRKMCIYPSNCAVLAQHNVPQEVVISLLKTPQHPTFQISGIGLIYFMATNDELRTLLAKASVGRVFINLFDLCNHETQQFKEVVPRCLLALERLTVLESSVRSFLGTNLYKKLAQVALDLLQQNDIKHVCKILKLLSLTCDVLIEARQPIKFVTQNLIQTILLTPDDGTLHACCKDLMGKFI